MKDDPWINPAFVPLNNKPFAWSDTLKPVTVGQLRKGRCYEFTESDGVMVIDAKHRKADR